MFVPKWGILKLLGDYRYLSIMKPQKKFTIKLQTLLAGLVFALLLFLFATQQSRNFAAQRSRNLATQQ
jgi:autotransporter translocation and assembly factor TamB